MADDHDRGSLPGEEIEGAPPVLSGTELMQRRHSESVTLNRYLYQQTQQFVHMLLQATDLPSLVETLLDSLPRHFSLPAAELWLFDPENTLQELVVGAERYGPSLIFFEEVFPLQELYEVEPDVEYIDATDSRMFDVLKAEQGVDSALLVPLTESGRMMGSLHLGMREGSLFISGEEQALLAHLALIISSCLNASVGQERIANLTLLDPLTEISNPRGFQRDLGREIARAQRAEHALTVLMMEIDDYEELYTHYGERRGNFVVRKVAERLCSDLRQTDLMARLTQPRFAVLLPHTDELRGRDIAERMRLDIEDFPVDDGRGAVLQVCLSIGMVTWEPRQYPAVDMARLAVQMESVAEGGLDSAKARGGNCIRQARLSTMMV
ncbi:MAG: hypothetical protein Hals2KO_38200 [Halioglobus sp.]